MSNVKTHAYRPGDYVIVHNETLGGRPISEGTATIVKCLDERDWYEVEFHREPGATYERFVAAAVKKEPWCGIEPYISN